MEMLFIEYMDDFLFTGLQRFAFLISIVENSILRVFCRYFYYGLEFQLDVLSWILLSAHAAQFLFEAWKM